jgi:hypothetical protein
MPIVFIEILKKVAPYLKYIVFGAAIVTLLLLWKSRGDKITELDKAMELYKRQMSGQLTDKEKALESANYQLGIAESKFMKQSDLLKAAQADKIQTTAEFEKFKKQYRLELESYQKTIAQLQQQIHGGTTTVVNGGEPRLPTDPKPDKQFDKPIDPRTSKLGYDWKSSDGRFELQDPDVFSSNNETFKLQQNFRITGEIYREKAGFLKTQRLTLEEVLPDGKNADGSVKYKTVAVAKVVDSKFDYSERAPDSWVPRKGVFGLWGVVSANFALNNGLNPRFLLGTGVEFLNWKGLGLGVQLYLDTNVWQDSGFGIDLAYRPTFKNTTLNIAIDVGIATQFRQPFQSYIPMVGLKFYLWN